MMAFMSVVGLVTTESDFDITMYAMVTRGVALSLAVLINSRHSSMLMSGIE